MVITPKNLIKHELIGFITEVIESTDKNKVGICGKIVDETEKTFIIETQGKKRKVLPKVECTFRFKVQKKVVDVNGKVLLGKPAERIKKRSSH